MYTEISEGIRLVAKRYYSQHSSDKDNDECSTTAERSKAMLTRSIGVAYNGAILV